MMSDRRVFLVALAAVGIGACRGGSRPVPPSVGLDELQEKGRTVVLLRGEPVEVLRTEAGVEARSLLCTHMGCQVKWEAERREYRCPCHAGRYDENGDVLEGMPTSPLRRVPFEVKENAVVFLG